MDLYFTFMFAFLGYQFYIKVVQPRRYADFLLRVLLVIMLTLPSVALFTFPTEHHEQWQINFLLAMHHLISVVGWAIIVDLHGSWPSIFRAGVKTSFIGFAFVAIACLQLPISDWNRYHIRFLTHIPGIISHFIVMLPRHVPYLAKMSVFIIRELVDDAVSLKPEAGRSDVNSTVNETRAEL